MPTVYRYAEFPIAQPLKFQEADLVVADADLPATRLPFDKVSFRDRLYPDDTKPKYAQKWENADTWIVEFSAETTAGSDINLYDACTGENMLLATSGQHTTIAGNLAPNGNALRTEHWTGNFVGVPTGVYYMEVTITFNDSPNFDKIYRSEPLFIADKHPNTVLLKYTNEVNDPDFQLFFEQFPCYYGLRVEGRIYDLSNNSFKTQYEDETAEITMLKGTPYRGWTFTAKNIPEWMGDKIGRAMLMSEWYANNVKYALAMNAEWDKTKNIQYPLHGYTINIRQQGENGLVTFSTPSQPPPFVCTNVNIDMIIAPWPDFNILDNNNLGGIDRSIVKAKFDPTLTGLTPPYTALWYQFIGSGIVAITGRPGIPDFDPNSTENYFQRGATAYEAGDTTISCAATITDSNGCQSLAGTVIDFAIQPPWGPCESVKYAGQLGNSDFVGFTISNITNNGFDVDVDNPVLGNNYYISLDGGLSLIGTSWDGLTTQTITGLPAATTQNIYVIAGTTHPISAMGPRRETTLP